MWVLVSSNANLVVSTEGIGLAHTAIALEHAIVRGLFRDQIQRTLQSFTRCFGSECFLGSPELCGAQSDRNLNERPYLTSCRTEYKTLSDSVKTVTLFTLEAGCGEWEELSQVIP